MDGGRGGARAGGGGLALVAVQLEATMTASGAQGSGVGGVGRAASMGMTQAAHFAGSALLPGPSTSPPICTVSGPCAEQSTRVSPGRAAAMAPNGSSVPSTMANVAARKASERAVDQVSACERVTRRG